MEKSNSTGTNGAAFAKWLIAGGLVLVVSMLSIAWATGGLAPTSGGPSAEANDAPSTDLTASTAEEAGPGLAAIDQAAKDGKYLLVFFWKQENDQTAAMRKVFDEVGGKTTDRAQSVTVCVTDVAERGIVKRFGVDRAPMPLALAIAPNGAVMGGFPTRFSVDDLLGAFGSPSAEKCMKGMQDGKLVFLCIQNANTQQNAEALAGVEQFRADARYARAAELVMLDPSDKAESSFLRDLEIDLASGVATTVFLAPPGSVVAEFKGPTTKEALVSALQSAGSCGPGGGCGPGGCGPR